MVTACRHRGNCGNTGNPMRREARSQPDAREGQAGPHRVADRLVVPLKPGNSGGGKGPEFKKDDCRGKGQGEWCKPKTSRSTGQDPQASSHLVQPVKRLSHVLSCPRAGCGKTACPVRRAGSRNGTSVTALLLDSTHRNLINIFNKLITSQRTGMTVTGLCNTCSTGGRTVQACMNPCVWSWQYLP